MTIYFFVFKTKDVDGYEAKYGPSVRPEKENYQVKVIEIFISFLHSKDPNLVS